jgi:hypothetical protein
LPSSSDCSAGSIGWLSRRAQNAAKALEEPELVLVDPDRVEGAHVERPHLDVLHAATAQRLGRALPGQGHALWPDETVVLVLDLQHVRIELPVFAVDLDADALVVRVWRRDRVREVTDVVVEAVDRHLQRRLVLVAVTEVTHAQ